MPEEADETVTVELGCPGWPDPYRKTITRGQLAELLLQIDDMADLTAEEEL